MNSAKKKNLLATAFLAVSLLNTAAQPAVVTVTNYVTVMVTNVVTITNIVTHVPAPVTTAKPPAPATLHVAEKYPWQSSVSAGLTLTRGNSDSMLFSANFLTHRKTPFDEYNIGLSAAYGNQDAQETVNNYKAFVQWNHLFTQRFYAYSRVDGLRDIIADVDYRASLGPGAGYYLVKETNTTLAAEIGGAFEAQRLDGEDQTFATIRLAERFEHKFDDHARLWENVELLPQVDKFDNYVVNFEIGVETLLTKTLSLKTYLDDTYQNQPAPGKLKNDAQIITAVSYKF